MPFDAPASPSARRTEARGPRRPVDLTLGVFSADGGWKVYSDFGRAAAYPSRQDAVLAAEARALEAVRAGRRVELFVQDEDGAFRQADLGLN